LAQSGWVLLNPSGNFVPQTFDICRWSARCKAFDIISNRLGDPWRIKFWKLPELAEKNAAKMGWKMVRCIRSEHVEYRILKTKKKEK
jgi:hypothetical protein